MGAIDTEDAARRLARVILSDIDLYIRERPKAGESREAQIEEGRRLFASRVTPALVPVFAMVLADRAAGTVKAPAAPRARPIPASEPAPAVGPVHSSPAPSPAIDDESPTDPSIADPFSEDQPPSAPVPVAPPVAAAALPPPPIVTRPAPPVAAAALPPPPIVTGPAPAPPGPLQPPRVPIRRLLAIASVLAAIAAVFHRFFR